jgi:photosystem II stability/assembly factor-like uncharacterized protein
MKNKTKYLLEAAVTIAVLASFVMPGAAITPKTLSMNTSHGVKPLPRAEWFEQASGFPTASRGIDYFSVIDENIVWAEGYDGQNPFGPCQDYTKTIDGGTTWSANTIAGADGLRFTMLSAIDVNTCWACMFSAAGTGPQGIWYTSDGGNTWAQQTTAAFDPSSSVSFPDCVHFFDANVGWCMGDPRDGYFEIYTTNNSGTNWERVPSANIPAPLSGEFGVMGYSTSLGDTIWYGTNLGRIYKSTDRGHHWTVAQTTNPAYIKPAFRDADHGLVIDLNSAASAILSETSDGGATWTDVPFSGTCYDSDICYVPGTTNMYISCGGAAALSGASYSLDGGHSWTDYSEFQGGPNPIQLLALGFTANKVGWAGSFNVDETTGGVWKHVQAEVPKPQFTIEVTGGKGLIVNVKNVGDGDATNVNCVVNITGGLWVKQRLFTETKSLIAVGGNFSFTKKVMGIGLGIIKKPLPSITITVTCSENVTATRTVNVKIFLSKVTLQ